MTGWAAVVVGMILVSPTLTAAQCTGDCNADARVTVNELTVGVRLALGDRTPGVNECMAALDLNGDERVTVDELIAAIGYALSGCRTCPEFDQPYAASCAMMQATVQCEYPPGAVVRLDGWSVESDGHLISFQLHGANPEPIFYGEVTDAFHATITGIEASHPGMIDPQDGTAQLANRAAGQTLELSGLDPVLQVGGCRSMTIAGAP